MSDFRPEEKIAVFPDTHGFSSPVKEAVKFYEKQAVDRIVFNGDLINRGPDSAGVLHIAQSLGATVLIGNHEMYLLAALMHEDPEVRERVVYDLKIKMANDIAKLANSYGIETNRGQDYMVASIEDRMREAGHLDMLARAAMYFEGKDFFVVHAGLKDSGLLLQKQELFYAKKDLFVTNDDDKDIDRNEPMQILSHKLANQQDAFKATDKAVVTGHAHHIEGKTITADGKRVRLATDLAAGEPLKVWQSWDGRIKEFG